ncbi:MAG: hypothetical protein CM15mL4_0580 [uncultured marine virus]|nr:MAG: hypothetical protein CM15mL4_0580 [uncultured marine virus]
MKEKIVNIQTGEISYQEESDEQKKKKNSYVRRVGRTS